MIFQDDLLFPHLSVAANIRFGLKAWRRATGRRPAGRGGGALRRGATARPDAGARSPAASGSAWDWRGRWRRAPGLLLCDEPVSALDLANRHALLERLRAIQRALAIPVLYVTHSPAEAIALGTPALPPGTRTNRRRRAAAGRAFRHRPPAGAWNRPGKGSRNVFPAMVTPMNPSQSATRIRLDDGPELSFRFLDQAPERRLQVAVPADDILLSRHASGGLSAAQPDPRRDRASRSPRFRGRSDRPHGRAYLDRQPGGAGRSCSSSLCPASSIHMSSRREAAGSLHAPPPPRTAS